MQIQLPYGRTTIPFDAPSDRIISSRLSSRKPLAAGETLVQEAMRHPIGSATLAELAVGKKNAVIIISDHTRPVPSRDILPHMPKKGKKNRRHTTPVPVSVKKCPDAPVKSSRPAKSK